MDDKQTLQAGTSFSGTGYVNILPNAKVEVNGGATISFDIPFRVQGKLDIGTGTINSNQRLDWTDGVIDGGTFNAHNAVKIDGGANNTASPTLTVTGNYIQGTQALLQLFIAGPCMPSCLVVGGNVILDGLLTFTTQWGYTPQQDDTIAVLSWNGTSTGFFSSTPVDWTLFQYDPYNLHARYLG